jgi:site-specific recombinase XerD
VDRRWPSVETRGLRPARRAELIATFRSRLASSATPASIPANASASAVTGITPMIVVLWRAGLRIQEALALWVHDSTLGADRFWFAAVRAGAGARSAWTSGAGSSCMARSQSSAASRAAVLHIDGPTRGRPWSDAAVRCEFRRLAAAAGIRRRFAPHQLRHAHALELAREGVPLNIIQRQPGHANLGTLPRTHAAPLARILH